MLEISRWLLLLKRRFLIIKTEQSSINTLHFYEKPKKGALQTMSLRAFNYGANAVCFEKNGRKYGMICSWATQVDYDKIVMLLGAQSVTGNNIAKGDIIGVSVLSIHQEDVMNTLGSDHSDEVDKFANIKYTRNDSAILIDNACVCMTVEVIDVLHLEGIEEDNLVYGLIKSYTQNDAAMITIN
jgi:flavin reductase (DIM6/NTAB) family NADH-FMN oxidoreductase RutF